MVSGPIMRRMPDSTKEVLTPQWLGCLRANLPPRERPMGPLNFPPDNEFITEQPTHPAPRIGRT